MNISELSIRRPVLSTVLTLIILLFGFIGYNYLGVREYPSVDNPIISVSCSYPGANADVIENQITEPLEQNINGIPGIRSLSSVSQQGSSRITVEFELSVDLETAAPVSACLAALPMPLTSCPLTVPATAALSRSWCTRSKPRFTFWRTKLLPEPISSRCGQKRWRFTEVAGSSWLSAPPCSGISKNTSGILCRRTPKSG